MLSQKCLSSQIDDLVQLLEGSSSSNTSTINKSNITKSSRDEPKIMSEETKEEKNDDDDESNRLNLKTAKGTIDYGPGDMMIRETMMKSIRNNMRKFGGQFMETPVFELRDILMDKYGEDEKLIYDLAQQEAETLCLRYDLTVPLARYVAMNRKNMKSPFKAARIGRVYRRDQPYMTRGRMREFWQCDFDIVRTSEPTNLFDLIFDDTEIVSLTIQQLIDLNFGNFYLLINNRKLLDSILDICNVPNDKIRLISSSIDKLDKKEWNEIKCEMIEKGINEETANKIRQFVEIKGSPNEVIEQLKSNKYIIEYDKNNDNKAMNAIREFEMLLTFLQNYNSEYLKYLRIDMSMVRGLDYYTGIIMEAQFEDAEAAANYGSIAGGGRYDKLVSRFVSSKDEKYPCCGSSIGFERIFCYLKEKNGTNSGVSTDILICELAARNGPKLGLFNQRLSLLQELRANNDINVDVEFMAKIAPGFRDQINYAEQREIKWMIIIGDTEIQNNTVNLRRLTLKNDMILTKDNKKGTIIDIVTSEKSKWPEFIVKPLITPRNNNKNWTLNKKQISKVIQNDIEFNLQMTIPRNELIDFFQKLYPN